VKNLLAFKIDIGESFWIKDNVGIGSDQAKKAGFGSIGEILSNLLNNVYVLAGVILFILLIVGGFMFMIGAGQENPEKAKKGKQAITAALIGFAVIFCSYWIIRIIEIVTAVNILNPGL
jgi:hypothetical protein